MDKTTDSTHGPLYDTEQRVTLTDRARLTVSGVTEVLKFDDTTAAFETTKGRLTIRGEELRVESMDVEAGNVALKGRVNALGYSGDGSEKSGMLGKLFR